MHLYHSLSFLSNANFSYTLSVCIKSGDAGMGSFQPFDMLGTESSTGGWCFLCIFRILFNLAAITYSIPALFLNALNHLNIASHLSHFLVTILLSCMVDWAKGTGTSGEGGNWNIGGPSTDS